MVTSSNAVVKPTLKLASSTLITSNPQSAARRKSTLVGGRRPSGLGEIDGAIVQGPSLPPVEPTIAIEEQPEPVQESPNEEAADSASDTTLVGDIRTPPSDEEDMVNVDSFNSLQTMKDEPLMSSDIPMPDSPAPLLDQPDTPAADTNGVADEDNPGEVYELPADDPSPPARPPPVPPRPKIDIKQTDLVQEIEFAAKQQDVTEVMDNVLFQIECAIKPTAIEADGEQRDQIKE